MKQIVSTFIFVALVASTFSCSIQRGTNQTNAGRLTLRDTTQAKDSLEYELLVFDHGFEYWLNSRAFSKNQYSNTYLQNMNTQYVNEWNRMYSAGDRLISSYIDYSPQTEYDLELNYQLYMYFQYFQETYKVKLLPFKGR
ncbi:MAG: hypothetical protein EOM16_04750 [Bacteroidia bacterium]|nr:hypothetical protein [Bacteroidia bacterium]